MARPRKIFEGTGEQKMDAQAIKTDEPKVKQIIRFLANVTNTDQTAIQDVDKLLGEYLADGWKLFNSHFIGRTTEGSYIVLYILIKD